MNKRKILFSVGFYRYLLMQKIVERSIQARWRFTLAILIALAILLLAVIHPKHQISIASPAPAPSTAITMPTPALPQPASSAAITLSPLSGSSCPHGTILTTVAHQDDDLLFMNPAIQQSITAGTCMRTVYVTAGDDGNDASYWQQREQGSLAAYALMFNAPDNWSAATAQLNGHALTAYSLVDHPQVSLLFMHLPDGGPGGRGFAATAHQSLRALRNGTIPALATVDGTSSYSRSDLINTLRWLINLDKPSVINTQAFSASLATGDHSDHQAVGYFTTVAAAAATNLINLHRYIGYEAGNMAPNLSIDQITAKLNVFSAYEAHDPAICRNGNCFNSFLYQRFLSRQYEQANPGL